VRIVLGLGHSGDRAKPEHRARDQNQCKPVKESQNRFPRQGRYVVEIGLITGNSRPRRAPGPSAKISLNPVTQPFALKQKNPARRKTAHLPKETTLPSLSLQGIQPFVYN
jgi:hypothetical protein